MNDFFIKIAIFAIVGFISSVFSMSLKPDNTPKRLVTEGLLSAVIAVVAGILFQRFVLDELEIAGVAAAGAGIFTADLIREVREIIDKASEMVPNKFDKKSDKTDEENQQN